jgi:hypothetical protein
MYAAISSIPNMPKPLLNACRNPRLTSGPINAIYFDRAHGTLRGGSSNYGEDYGIAW